MSEDAVHEILERHDKRLDQLGDRSHDHAQRLTKLEFALEEMTETFNQDLVLKVDRTHLVTEDIKRLVWVIIGAMVPSLVGLVFLLIRAGGK